MMNNYARRDLASAFRWAARLNLHEEVANHSSVAINDSSTRFLMNPHQRYFSRIKASELIEIDVNDPEALTYPDAPDITPGACMALFVRKPCVMYVHSNCATVLASLSDSRLPPIGQNTATFFNRYVIDDDYGGLALEDEGNRCAQFLSEPKKARDGYGQSWPFHEWAIGRSRMPLTGSITLSAPPPSTASS